MWAYGHHFHTKDANDGCVTVEYGVKIKFNQSSHASHRDHNIIEAKSGYIEKIQEIMQVEFSSFQCVICR